MSLYLGEQLTKEEVEKYNKQLSEMLLNGPHGCISGRPCSNCNIMVYNTICLCAGNFTCPSCDFKNGIDYEPVTGNFTKNLIPLIKLFNRQNPLMLPEYII